MSLALGLLVPFGAIAFVLGMLLARWQITSRPEQAGLRHIDNQKQDEHHLRWVLDRRNAIQVEDDRLAADLFATTQRIEARAIAKAVQS